MFFPTIATFDFLYARCFMKNLWIVLTFFSLFFLVSCVEDDEEIAAGEPCSVPDEEACSANGDAILVCSDSSWEQKKSCDTNYGEYCQMTANGKLGCGGSGNNHDTGDTNSGTSDTGDNTDSDNSNTAPAQPDNDADTSDTGKTDNDTPQTDNDSDNLSPDNDADTPQTDKTQQILITRSQITTQRSSMMRIQQNPMTTIQRSSMMILMFPSLLTKMQTRIQTRMQMQMKMHLMRTQLLLTRAIRTRVQANRIQPKYAASQKTVKTTHANALRATNGRTLHLHASRQTKQYATASVKKRNGQKITSA